MTHSENHPYENFPVSYLWNVSPFHTYESPPRFYILATQTCFIDAFHTRFIPFSYVCFIPVLSTCFMTVCIDLASGSYVCISFATSPTPWTRGVTILIGVQCIVVSSIVFPAQASCEWSVLFTPLGVGSSGQKTTGDVPYPFHTRFIPVSYPVLPFGSPLRWVGWCVCVCA